MKTFFKCLFFSCILIILSNTSKALADGSLTLNKLYSVANSEVIISAALTHSKTLYTADKSGTLVSTNVADGAVNWKTTITLPNGGLGVISIMAMSPAGDIILAALETANFAVLEAKTGKVLKLINRPSRAGINSIDIASDGNTAATSDVNGNVIIWNILTGQYEILTSLEFGVVGIKFSYNDFLVVCEPQSIKLWNLLSKTVVRTLIDPTATAGTYWFTGMGTTHELNYLVAINSNKSLLFDITSGTILTTFDCECDAEIMTASLNEDNTELVTADRAAVVVVWDAATGAQKQSQGQLSFSFISHMITLSLPGHYFVAGMSVDIFGLNIKPSASVWKYKESFK